MCELATHGSRALSLVQGSEIYLNSNFDSRNLNCIVLLISIYCNARNITMMDDRVPCYDTIMHVTFYVIMSGSPVKHQGAVHYRYSDEGLRELILYVLVILRLWCHHCHINALCSVARQPKSNPLHRPILETTKPRNLISGPQCL